MFKFASFEANATNAKRVNFYDNGDCLVVIGSESEAITCCVASQWLGLGSKFFDAMFRTGTGLQIIYTME